MTELLYHTSYLGIFFVLVVTGFGIPIPEEVSVMTAGVLSANGTLNPWIAYFVTLAGAIGGDCVTYGLGYHFGRSVLYEHPRISRHLTPEREKRLERLIENHGVKAIFILRFMTGVRSPMFLTVGILRMPFRRFILIDSIAAVCVVSAVFGLSYRYGASIMEALRGMQLGYTAIVVLAVAVLCGIYLRRRRLRVLSARARKAARAENRSTRAQVGDNSPSTESPATPNPELAESFPSSSSTTDG